MNICTYATDVFSDIYSMSKYKYLTCTCTRLYTHTCVHTLVRTCIHTLHMQTQETRIYTCAFPPKNIVPPTPGHTHRIATPNSHCNTLLHLVTFYNIMRTTSSYQRRHTHNWMIETPHSRCNIMQHAATRCNTLHQSTKHLIKHNRTNDVMGITK